jgi:hypothetical protein
MRLRKLVLSCAWLCATVLVVTVNPQPAAAFAVTYVSNGGNDANQCNSPPTACLTFGRALAQTDNNGEIDCLNGGFYSGFFTISKSVTFDCNGSVASAVGGFTINGAGIVVRLRNLTFNTFGFGGFAIDGQNMAALYVENCVITNSTGGQPFLGIRFEPSANAKLFVTNSVISNNGNFAGAAGGGISIAPRSGATASVTLDGVKLVGNVYGIGLNSAGGLVVGTMRHSLVSSNSVSGLVAFGGGSPILWSVDASSIMNNSSYGVQSIGSGVNLQIGGSTITGNGTGVNGAGIVSFKNNQIGGNATDGTPLPAFAGPGGAALQ